MTVAITGATGFLGGHVLTHLLAAGYDVRALARSPQSERGGVTWISGALDQPEALDDLVRGCDVVIHIAGVVNAADAAAFDRGNHIGTSNMVSASPGRRFIHVSSIAAREPGLSNYGGSKRAGEDAVTSSALDWVVVRPPAIFGPGDREMLDMFRMAKAGLAALPPGGRISVIHADDLARLIVTLADHGPSRIIYEPDDGEPNGWSHREFAQAMGDAVGRRVLKFALPKAALRVASRLDTLARRGAAKLTQDRVSYFCHPNWVSDPDKRVGANVWKPEIATPKGLRDTAAWYRAAGWL